MGVIVTGDCVCVKNIDSTRDCNPGTLCQSRDPETFISGIPGSRDPDIVINASKRDCLMEYFAVLSFIYAYKNE